MPHLGKTLMTRFFALFRPSAQVYGRDEEPAYDNTFSKSAFTSSSDTNWS